MTPLDACLYLIIWSFLGWCAEEVYHTVTYGDFTNRGFVNGPVCTIYGVGFTSVIWILGPLQDKLLLLFFASLALTTGLELATGWVLEKIFHTKWWDYSEEPLNIGGYVCLKFAIIWGLTCTAVLKLVQPVIDRICHSFSHRTQLTFVIVCAVIYACDYIVTVVEIRKIQIRLGVITGLAHRMDEIATTIGEGLHEGTLKTMEVTSEVEKKSAEAKEALGEKAHAVKEAFDEKTSGVIDAIEDVTRAPREVLEREFSELRQKISGMLNKTTFTYRRLDRAFPGLNIAQRVEHLLRSREDSEKDCRK